MKAISIFLISITSLKVYSQDCHIPAMDYTPKEFIGSYSLYEFTLNAPKKIKDSVLLVTATYDSLQLTQTKIAYTKVHTMAGTHRDPGIDKIQLDTNGNVLSLKKYAEKKSYNNGYKYVGLEQCTYDDKGCLLSASTYASANIPMTFAYTDSSFEETIKHNYSHRANPDCISRYHYKDSLITVIENYRDGSLTFRNQLSYASGKLTEAKAYKPDGTLFSIVEFIHIPTGFTQTLSYYSGQDKDVKKEDDSYYWKYTKDKDKVVEIEYGKNNAVIDRNKYTYDIQGRLETVKLYDGKSLKYTYKYYYE